MHGVWTGWYYHSSAVCGGHADLVTAFHGAGNGVWLGLLVTSMLGFAPDVL